MNIVRQINDIPFAEYSVVTVGTFDGVHLAHQNILKKVVEEARKIKGRSIVITFDPHPRELLSKGNTEVKLLSTINERQELCAQFGIDWFLILTFNYELSQLSYRDFTVNYIVNAMSVASIVEGYDHHWGKGREGNINSLLQLSNEFNFKVLEVKPVVHNGTPINSSLIRKMIEEGNVEAASGLLGRYYSISGIVIEGNKRGRLLGYPTANIEIDSKNKLVPKRGIYFGQVVIDRNKYYGMVSIGNRPTFESNGNMTIEVNILDFNQDIYGSNIKIEFIHWMRDELKFDSAHKLIEQMNLDKEKSFKLRYEYEN